MSIRLPEYVIENVAKRIAGDIVWSDTPSIELRRWREIYGLSQVEIARIMKVSYSVVSDYERGKREPGRKFIRQFVKALLEYDSSRDWAVTRQIAILLGFYVEGVIDMAEFLSPISLEEILRMTKGILVTPFIDHRPIKGYTIVDSIRTIESIAANEFVKLMGATSDRVIVFTRITRGRSPLVAIRVAPVKPSVVILHGVKKVDIIAIRIAIKEYIPLIIAPYMPIEEIAKNFRNYTISAKSSSTIYLPNK